MYKLPLSLQHIIYIGDPSTLDLNSDIPSTFQEYIMELQLFSMQKKLANLIELDCVIAFDWKRWWPWLACALELNHVFECKSHLSPQVIQKAFICATPALLSLTQILSFSSMARETQSNLACKIVDSSNFNELISLAWVVALIYPHT